MVCGLRSAVCGLRVMGDHDDGLVIFTVKQPQKIQNFIRRCPVKIPRGFITHQQTRVGNNGPGNGHPLFLPSGEFRRLVVLPVRQAHYGQGRLRPLLSFGATEAGQQKGQFHISQGGQYRQEIVKLEYKAHVGGAPLCEL